MESLANIVTKTKPLFPASKPIEPAKCEKCGAMVEPIRFNYLGEMRLIPGTCKCVQREWERQDEEAKRKDERKKIERVFSLSQLGPRFAECTFDNWTSRPGTSAIHDAAANYVTTWERVKANGEGLIMLGPVATGKSHLAAAIVNALVKRGITAIFQSTPELMSRIRATFDKGSTETERNILSALENADLLVLDDLGAEKTTEATRARLYQVIDARYRYNRPIIVTTNCEIKELEEQIGTRAFDRLCEICAVVKANAPSYRMEIARSKMAAKVQNAG